MTKATLNVQHEYITARTVWHQKPLCSMNLTTSYSGEKCTARGVEGTAMKRVWQAFLQHRKLVGEGKLYADNGKQMEGVRKLAERSTDPVNLAELLEAEVASAHGVAPVKVVAKVAELTEVAPPKLTPAKAYSQEELQAAFDTVKNKKDWKARIDARINKKDADVVLAAIAHFTGTAGYTKPHMTNPDKLIVRAAGYRMGPCGDR